MPKRRAQHPGLTQPGWKSHRLFWLGDHSTWEEADGRNENGAASVFYDVETGAGHVERHGMMSGAAYRNCLIALHDFNLDDAFPLTYDMFGEELEQHNRFVRAAFPDIDTCPTIVLSGREQLAIPMYEDIRTLGSGKQRVAAAAAAAVLDSNCWQPIRVTAYEVLQVLPPRISIRHHASVAKGLWPFRRAINETLGRHRDNGSCEEMAIAAHTLACLGPEAVCEHYDAITRLADEAGACESAAWLAVAVLEPSHMLGLELRGHRPVDDFLRRHVEDLWLGIRLRGLRPTSFGQAQMLNEGSNSDSFRMHTHGSGPACMHTGENRFENWAFDAIPKALEAERDRARRDPQYHTVAASGRVILDAPSRLAAFEPAALWSPQTHADFPSAAQARAVELFRLGLLLGMEQPALGEVFNSIIVPFAVEHRALPGGRHIFREEDRTPPRPFPINSPFPDPTEIMWHVEEARQARKAHEAAYSQWYGTSGPVWVGVGAVRRPTKSRLPTDVPRCLNLGQMEIRPPQRPGSSAEEIKAEAAVSRAAILEEARVQVAREAASAEVESKAGNSSEAARRQAECDARTLNECPRSKTE